MQPINLILAIDQKFLKSCFHDPMLLTPDSHGYNKNNSDSESDSTDSDNYGDANHNYY